MKVSNHTLLLGCVWLVAALTVRVAHTAVAARADQYDERHDMPPPPPPRPATSSQRREATDRRRSHGDVLEVNANPDRNHDNDRVKLSMIVDETPADARAPNHDKRDRQDLDDRETGMDTNELGEMQVGCGHGLFEVVPAPQETIRKEKKSLRKRAIEKMKERKRRNYHSAFTIWQPPVYQLTRPYVIPVWGAQGQVPIYFPPQPIHPDTLDDPRKSYLPPKGYLPPRTTTIGYDDDSHEDPMSAGGNEGDITLNNRNNFDDAPIWDIEPIQTRPPQFRPQTRPPIRTTPAPGRTRRPGTQTTTFPPLVHRSENNTSNSGAQRPNSLRPVQDRPSVAEAPSFQPPQGGAFGGVPQTTPPPPPRPRPSQLPSTSQPSRAQPSRCVWAIISCCQGNNQNISYSCFEQLGCTGAFWDKSPCDSDFAKAAVDIALQYYSQK